MSIAFRENTVYSFIISNQKTKLPSTLQKNCIDISSNSIACWVRVFLQWCHLLVVSPRSLFLNPTDAVIW